MKNHKSKDFQISTYPFLKITLLFVLLFSSLLIMGQEENDNSTIQKSKNIVSIDGQKFYIHIVEKGQYLFSISKAYQVSQDEIIKHNPGAKYGLQTDQAIKIPVVDNDQENNEKEVAQDPAIKKESKPQISSPIQIDPFIYHKVDSGQTVYRLSKMYDIPVDTIYYYNPLARTVLKIGDVIKIPKSQEGISKGAMQYTLKTKFITHQVEKKETLFSLSRKYDVSISDLIRNNKELVWGLKYGQNIKIPVIDTIYHEAYTVLNDSVVVDSTVSMTDPFIAYEYFRNICDSATDENQLKKLNIAILIPLQQKRMIALEEKIAQSEHIAEEDMTIEYAAEIKWAKRKHRELSMLSSNFIDFYLGALMAIDTLKKSGISVNVELFDTERDTSKIMSFFTQDGIENVDLIIGPFYSNNIRLATRFTNLYKIPLVSPLSNDPEILKNAELVFQATPSNELMNKAAAKLISQHQNENIILLYRNDTLSKLNAVTVKSDIFSYLSTQQNIDSILFKEILFSDSVEFHLEHTLSENKENFIFVMSSDMALVTNIISNLYFLTNKYNITVFGEPQWQRFNNIDMNQFHNLNIQLYSPFYVDYHSDETKKFLAGFRENYEYEPHYVGPKGEMYSLLGYDLTYYFVSALHKYGDKFYRCIAGHHPTLLLSDYKFIKYNGNKGYENISISIITYTKNLEITKSELMDKQESKRRIFGKN